MDFDLTPIFRSPYTDLGSCLVSHQQFSPCAKAELRAMGCLEAHGVHKGLEKCQELIKDYNECYRNLKQLKRAKYMLFERQKQYITGKRETLYAEDPKTTSF